MIAKTHLNQDKDLLILDLIYILKCTKNCPAQICVPIFSHGLPTVPLLLIENTVQNSSFSQCYKIFAGDDSKKWQEARKYCQSQGGNLVSVLNQGEQGEHLGNVLLIFPLWFSAKVHFIMQ